MAALALMPGDIVITSLEGDLMHTLSASQRMAEGELPHLDFMTPLGILAFAPIAMFLSFGFFLGKSIILSSMTLAIILLPVIWWIGVSRLGKAQAVYFGALVLVLLMAVTFGNGSSFTVLALHYNRWAWALAFVVLGAVLFPPRFDIGERWMAPLVIGGGMAALAMLKVTFFAVMAPAILIILLAQKQVATALRSVIFGALIGVVLVAYLGADYFAAYFENLLSVTLARSGRSAPWESFTTVLTSPKTLSGTVVLLGAILVFRKSGMMLPGLVMLLLSPVFVYITYQNWGNDPKWMLLVVLYLWVNLPKAGETTLLNLPARQSILALILIGGTSIFPTAISLLWSPLRAFTTDRSNYVRIENPPMAADILVAERLLSNVVMRRAVEGTPNLLPLREPVEINGTVFPDCQTTSTTLPMAAAMAAELEALGAVRGQPVLAADSLDIIWLFGDITRVAGAAPWYYSDDAGLENAAFLLVPLCPLDQDKRREMVRQFQAAKYGLSEVYRSNLMVLYEVAKPVE